MSANNQDQQSNINYQTPQKSLYRSSSFIRESDYKTPQIHKNFGQSRVGFTLQKYKQMQNGLPSRDTIARDTIACQTEIKHQLILDSSQPKLENKKEQTSQAKPSLSYYGNLLTEGRPLKLSDYTDMDCILEPDQNRIGGLYLGNINGAKDLRLLRTKRIGAVLTVLRKSGIQFKDNKEISHLIFEVDDADYVNLFQYFDKAVQFIDQHRKTSNVFVHCYAGISRSAAIIIAYIMRNQDLNFNDALQFVKKKRKIISPNNGFQKQLKQYENILIERQNQKKNQNSLKKEQSPNPNQYSYQRQLY